MSRRVYSVERASRGAQPESIRVWLHYGSGAASCVEITAGDVGLARATGIITPVGAEPVEISGPMLDEIERLLLRGAA